MSKSNKSNKLAKQSVNLPDTKQTPDKTETWAGKYTARVTHTFKKPDGTIYKATKKINKDGSISEKLERRHP